MRKDNKRTIALYMFPAILMIVVLLYLPIFINLYESFFSWGAMSSSHKFVGIGNYMKMFKDEVFYTALKNNMIFMIMSVIFQIGLSLIIANTLESKFMRKTQNIFQSIYFIPSLLMVTVVGIAIKMICSPSIGIINPLLELIGINTENIDKSEYVKAAEIRKKNTTVKYNDNYVDRGNKKDFIFENCLLGIKKLSKINNGKYKYSLCLPLYYYINAEKDDVVEVMLIHNKVYSVLDSIDAIGYENIDFH